MNILLITLEYPPFKGGVANYYGNLVKYWPEAGNIRVLADKKRDRSEKDNDNRVIRRRLVSRLFVPKWLGAVWHLHWTVKQHKIDHILVGQILPLGTAAYIVSLVTGKPYTVFIHGMDITYAQRKRRKRRMARRILKRADKIICGNSYTAGLVESLINSKSEILNAKQTTIYKHQITNSVSAGKRDDRSNSKIFTVNPGIEPIDLDKYRARADKLRQEYNLEDKTVLFSVGRLVRRKGFDRIMQALPKAQKYADNLAYVYAGDGPEKYDLRRAAKGVRNITYLGKISEDEKWAWLLASDIFIMPAREAGGDFEGFGIVYLEANLAGKPVIAGNTGGVSDAVQATYSGLLVNPEDTEELANNIITLAKNKQLREQMGQAGRQRALNEFQWQKQIAHIFDIINKSSQ